MTMKVFLYSALLDMRENRGRCGTGSCTLRVGWHDTHTRTTIALCNGESKGGPIDWLPWQHTMDDLTSLALVGLRKKILLIMLFAIWTFWNEVP